MKPPKRASSRVPIIDYLIRLFARKKKRRMSCSQSSARLIVGSPMFSAPETIHSEQGSEFKYELIRDSVFRL